MPLLLRYFSHRPNPIESAHLAAVLAMFVLSASTNSTGLQTLRLKPAPQIATQEIKYSYNSRSIDCPKSQMDLEGARFHIGPDTYLAPG